MLRDGSQTSSSSRRATPQVTNQPVFGRRDHVTFFTVTAAMLTSVFYFGFHWVARRDWSDFPVVLGFLTLIIIVVLANNLGRWMLLPLMKRPDHMEPEIGLKVAVVTTFVPDAEPLTMLERTLESLVAIDYPHDTWLLDEGDRADVRDLCASLGVMHFSRKGIARYQTAEGQYKSGSKYGNYNAWLSEVGYKRYDILTAFDPDHVADPAFLKATLGYFRDPTVGYVQSAQAYGNQDESLVARGAAEETYAYFSSVLMASHGMGYPIIIGSHNSHRLAALEKVGGLAPHDADDILLTLRYRAAGCAGVYVPKILARGRAPVDWDSYLRQQRRWARSVLDIKFRRFGGYSARLSAGSRVMGLLHGVGFVHRSALILLLMILVVYCLTTGRAPEILDQTLFLPLGIMVVTLIASEAYRQRFYLDRRSEGGLHWRGCLLALAKWPQFLLASVEVLFDRRVPYSITSKAAIPERSMVFRRFNLVMIGAVGVAWLVGVTTGNLVDSQLHVLAGGLIVAHLALLLTDRGLRPRAARCLAADRNRAT